MRKDFKRTGCYTLRIFLFFSTSTINILFLFLNVWTVIYDALHNTVNLNLNG